MTIRAHALLFDNDGTLVSSLDSVERCWTRCAREYGITAEEFGRVELHGRPAVDIVADLLPARLVPKAVDDVDAAVINGNHAIPAGLKPTEDAPVPESAKNSPYGDPLAVQKGDEDPRVEKPARLLTSPEVKKCIEDKYRGSVLPSFRAPSRRPDRPGHGT